MELRIQAFQPVAVMMCWVRAGLLAAWRSRLATLRVKVTLAREMDACEAGMNGTTLDGADQLLRQSVA
jgi:hypothetical protein